MSGNDLTEKLAVAASKGKARAVQKLLAAGADANAKHKDKPILLGALKSGDAQVIQLLAAAGADPNATLKKGKTLLMEAADKGKLKWVEALIGLGADVNLAAKKDRQTALLLALWEGHEEIARLLISKGADIRHVKKGRKTALMYAVHSGKETLVRMLLEQGLDANQQNKDGQIPLMYAARSDDKLPVVRALLEHGADVNLTDSENKTVLCWASHYGSLELVKLLLQSGADVSTIDKFGDNVLSYGKQAEKNSAEILALLKAHGARELPRCTSYKLQVTCPECSQPIMINGPARRIKCGFCQSEQKLKKGFWKELFKDTADLGGTTTTMGGTSRKVEYRKSFPSCSECDTVLDLSQLDPTSAEPVVCPKCSTSHDTFLAPEWLRSINAKGAVPQRLFGAEREGGDEAAQPESVNPVAIRCISCAAPLTITVETPRNAVCGHCNTAQYLPDPLWLSLHPVKKAERWYLLFESAESD